MPSHSESQDGHNDGEPGEYVVPVGLPSGIHGGEEKRMSITLTLAGIPPSKKNSTISRVISKQVPKVGGDGLKWQHRVMVFPSSDYQKWEAEAANILKAQIVVLGERIPIAGPLHVVLVFGCSDRRSFDLSNKWEGVADALVKSGIIEDDGRFIIATTWCGWVPVAKGSEGVTITIDQIIPS